MPSRALDAEIDRLYQLPLDAFTAERNALAKRVGREDAGEVRALSKPPLAAWAVNQVFWKQQPVYRALIEAATALRKAHATVLGGKQADLRAIGKQHEEAIEPAIKAAMAILEESGHPASDAVRHAVVTTLRALPGDEPPGRLTRLLNPGGFETLAGIALGKPPAPVRPLPATRTAANKPAAEPEQKPHTRKTSAAETKAISRVQDALTAATRALRAAEHTARREEFDAARAGRQAEKAGRGVERAEQALEEARQVLEDAKREAAAAIDEKENAERRAREADEALTAARDRVDTLQEELRTLTT